MEMNMENSNNTEEKVYAKPSDFKGMNVCHTKKKLGFIQSENEKGISFDKAIAMKDIIKLAIKGEIEADDVDELVEGSIMNDMSVEETGKLINSQLAKDIKRYLKGEEDLKRKLIIPPEIEYQIGPEWTKHKPDALFVGKNCLEGIIYKQGKSNVNTKTGLKKDDKENVANWLPCYFTLRYLVEFARELAEKGIFDKKQPYSLRASFYFMRKTTDSNKYTARDNDYFNGSGGNIAYLEETHAYNEADHNTELDDIFLDYMEKAQVGFECSEDDCKNCTMYALCHYVKAPKKLPKVVSAAKRKVTPSKQQQEIIDEILSGSAKCIKVNAGAGTGKTATMTMLVTDLILRGIPVDKIFITSFTDAGVSEIKERIAASCAAENLPITKDDIHAITFNGFGNTIVCDKPEDAGLPGVPKILTKEIEMEYIEKLVNKTQVPGIDYSKLSYNGSKSIPEVITIAQKTFDIIAGKHLDEDDPGSFDTVKDALKECGLYMKMSDQSIWALLDLHKEFVDFYKEDGYLTFSDQEPLMLEVLKKNPDYLANLGYEYIIVDEFQDSNETQVGTIKMLMGTPSFKKLVVVGDDAQAIFAFRETSPEFMLNLDKYLGCEVKDMYLLENRRCTPEILKLANDEVSKNKNKVQKILEPTREHGKKPVVRGFHSKDKEYDFIVEEIKKFLGKGYNPDEIAFIASKKTELVAMGAKLSEAGIPWVMKNPMNLLENSRVFAALSLADAFYAPETTVYYFNYLVAKYDGEILNLHTADEINEEITQMKNRFLHMDDLSIPQQRRLFHQYLDALIPADGDELYEYFLELLYRNPDAQSELAYTRIFKKYGDKMARKMMQDYEGVVLVTAHSSKGLEWPIVFNSITGYDDLKFHGARLTTHRLEQVEEKRRLLFVSMTRARDFLYVTGQYALRSREDDRIYNMFLHEIYDLAGLAYDPVDHEGEALKRQKMEETRKKNRERYAKNKAEGKKKGVRKLSAEEKSEYEKLLAGQNKLLDL